MNFDPEKDFAIFDELLKKRPEITPNSLKSSLKEYYLPYVEKLLKLDEDLGKDKGTVVGVSAIQGAGKTTQGEILEVLLKHFNKTSVSLSIDDHYITHAELVELRNKDPRFIRRGVTHDIALAIKNIEDLVNFSGTPVLVSGYDKGAQKGDGDRFAFVNPVENLIIKTKVFAEEIVINKVPEKVHALKLISLTFGNQNIPIPENMGTDIPIHPQFLPQDLCNFLLRVENRVITVSKTGEDVYFLGGSDMSIPASSLPKSWHLVPQKPDFIFYDGWMVGAKKVEDESIFDSGLPALEKPEDREFAKFINKKLESYDPLWKLINFMNVLYVVDYNISLKWRDQAEDILRQKGGGMTHDQIIEFVHYFWRSVHPAIQVKNLAQDPETDQVVVINDDHSIKEVLKSDQVKIKYE